MATSNIIGNNLFNFYRLHALISDGPTARIYAVIDDNGSKYAAKFTKVTASGGKSRSCIAETEVYGALSGLSISSISLRANSFARTPEGFSNVYFSGKHDEYHVIIMDLLSMNLLRYLRDHTITARSLPRLACNMLRCLMLLHEDGFIHGDVKPQNFMFDKDGRINLIDFSLSRRYKNSRTNRHIPQQREQSFFGTLIYASPNAQRCLTLSRKDDLISLGYSFIEIMNGSLPWDVPRDPFCGTCMEQMMRAKENMPIDSLCGGLPSYIKSYMKYVINLSYETSPNFYFLLGLLAG